MATWLYISLMCCTGIVNSFLQQGFDPNAINGFGSGSFNPNTGQGSTIPPPSPGTGDSTTSGFNPNAGQWSTIAPPSSGPYSGGFPTPGSGNNWGNNLWGVGTGSGGFNPNVGYTTVAPPAVPSTPLPSANSFGNFWGFGTGSGGFNPNAVQSTVTPSIVPPTVALTGLTNGLKTTTGVYWEFGANLNPDNQVVG